jgi:hypothetical protein
VQKSAAFTTKVWLEETMNRTILVSMAIPLLSLPVLSSCAGGYQAGNATVDRSEPVCLSDYDIRSFNAIDDEFLYVEGRGNAHYLFTMQRGCIGLRGASVIGIPDRPGRICSNSLDDVIYRDISRGETSCRILNIERVSSREEARELAEARRKARREQ